jgi:hypothetical protein
MVSQAQAQVKVDVSAGGVTVQAGTGSVAVNEVGTLGPDVQMDGVAVINGRVYIDGAQVPKGKTTFKSPKSGKTYRIQWGKDGNVAVQEE